MVKLGKFIIFTTDNKRALPKERQKAIDEYLSTRKISCNHLFCFMDFLCFFCRTACFTKKSDSRISYKWKYFNSLLTSSSICDNSYSLLFIKLFLACQKSFGKIIKHTLLRYDYSYLCSGYTWMYFRCY